MSGAGGGPAGLLPVGGIFPPPPAPPHAALGSHRKLDALSRRYVVTDDGGFAVDDNIAQRVLLLLCFELKTQKLITTQSKSAFIAGVRSALSVLTGGRAPAIRILELEVEDKGTDLLFQRLRYFNNLTRTTQTLLPTGELVIK